MSVAEKIMWLPIIFVIITGLWMLVYPLTPFAEEHALLMAQSKVGNISLVMKCDRIVNDIYPSLNDRIITLTQQTAQCWGEREDLWRNLNYFSIGEMTLIGGFAGGVYFYLKGRKEKERLHSYYLGETAKYEVKMKMLRDYAISRQNIESRKKNTQLSLGRWQAYNDMQERLRYPKKVETEFIPIKIEGGSK